MTISRESILGYFPYPTMRPGQYAVLKWLEANWDRYDVFVLQVPVAGGKSSLAMTVGSWANTKGMSCGISTPDNVLVKQYRRDHNLPYLPIRRSFASGDSFTAAKEDFKQQPIKVMNNHTLLANRAYSDLQIFDECFTGDVEILTTNGWVRFDEIKGTEMVAQVHSDTMTLNYVSPRRWICKEVVDETIITAKNARGIDISATENHDFLVKKSSGITTKVPFRDVSFKSNKIPKAAKSRERMEKNLTPWEKLMIAYQADGSDHGSSTLAFSFSKQRKIDEFIKLVDGHFNWKEVAGNKASGNTKARRRFLVKVNQYYSKNLWEHFCIHQLGYTKCRNIIDYMLHWDGHKASDTCYYYSSVDKKNADFYQTVALMANYSTYLSKQVDDRKANFRNTHRLFITTNKTHMGRCNPEVTSKKYTGKVYCATVPAGNIVVRRNGKPIIVGNCHELIPMLQDFEGIKIWKHLTPYPSNIRTAAELLMWAASRGPKDKLGRKIGKLLGKNPMDYTIVHEEAAYRGHTRDCLRIYPLTPKNNAPILWPPSKVRKLVLMSATIAPPDIEDLGLHRRRVGYIEVPSDIPVERRKFIYAGVGSMGQANQTENIKRAVDKLIDIRSKHQLRRGFVHSTYGLARKIPDMPWLLKHDSVNKQQVLQRWLETVEDNRVFLGCGLTTGLDLKGGLASWQAIMKCQFPDLGDPAVMAKATNNPEWYQWVTIRQIVQAYGRVCRAPNDEGTTYILDSDFAMLYNKANHLFPQWFKEAIEWGL